MKDIILLDCTLRDGAYINNANFGETSIKGIINKLQLAGVEIIECGWLKDNPYEPGTSYFHVPNDIEQYIDKKNSNITYSLMIDYNRYNLDNLPSYNGGTINAIRVVFPHGKLKEGIEVGNKVIEKGYKVFFQAANTLAYSDEDLKVLAESINKTQTQSLSIVDTFGAMYEEDLERIVKILDKELRKDIRLGFHSHNNMQLSFALSSYFIRYLKKYSERKIMVDSSLCGMGRGAGNATTELMANYLNRKHSSHYDLDAIMDAIDIYMEYFQEKYEWGYSTPYFIAGNYCCHVNNIAYLRTNHRTSAKDMRNIIESLSPEDRKKYDYDLLEQKYLQNQSRYVDDSKDIQELRKKFDSRDILLIAPGCSIINEYEKINDYIKTYNPIKIGVNAIIPKYKYDYLFFVNPARYEYAKQSHREQFLDTNKLILSNIKNKVDDNDKEIVIAFNSVIKRGWEHFDNAVICCLRLLDRIGIKKISICGFDGFKTKYNESYADSFLPTLNPGNKWDELNNEIKNMFFDFKNNSNSLKSIYFITDSFFEK